MSTKTSGEQPAVVSEEFKEHGIKHVLGKFEYDLYKEEDDIIEKIIRVKRFNLPNKGQKWKIFLDNKVIFVIEGTKITKKEQDYLQTIDGFNFLLKIGKEGIKSMNHFKSELKKVMPITKEIGKKSKK